MMLAHIKWNKFINGKNWGFLSVDKYNKIQIGILILTQRDKWLLTTTVCEQKNKD